MAALKLLLAPYEGGALYFWHKRAGLRSSRFCAKFPRQTMKTVRLRLNLTRSLVETADLAVRVLLLVRDPRGSLESRRHRDWCPGHQDCQDPARLCQDLESDYQAYITLSRQFPGRYR